TNDANFCLDDDGYYINNTIFYISGNHLEYLTAFLNSNVCEWYFKKLAATSGVGTTRWIKQYIDQIAVPKVECCEVETKITTLVHSIQENKKQKLSTTDLEKNINELFLEMLNLAPEEIICVSQ